VAKLFVCALMLASGIAYADPVDDLIAKGQELGKQGELTQAIAAFKQADARRPRALHACLIGLAYTRRELWPQAEVFFAQCRAREIAGDIAPDWAGEAERTLAQKLLAANIPPITITVDPADAKITVSAFEADEVFPPGVIHLAPGRYQLKVRADGFAPTTREIVVVAGEPQTVEIELVDLSKRPPPTTQLPALVASGGALLLAGGLAVDLLVFQPLRDDRAKSRFLYTEKSADFDHARDLTVGLFAAGAIAVGVGVYLAVRDHRDFEVSAAIDHTGGMISVGWKR